MTAKDLVEQLCQSGVLKTPLIISAFEKVDRKDFVPESCSKEAYEDCSLPIGQGQTISQPWTVAFMLELLQPQPGEKIMDIGSGSGYTAALLAYCVSQKENPKPKTLISERNSNIKFPKGRVVALEIIPELCELGRQNCEKYGFVSQGIAEFFCRDGNPGLAERSPYDKILVGAALQNENLPEFWKTQLKIQGRVVCPIMNNVWVFDKVSGSEFEEKEHPGFSFVPFV